MFDIGGIVRYIGVYSKHAEPSGEYAEVAELELNKISLTKLQKIFSIDPNDPNEDDPEMVCAYDIDEEKAKLLQPYVKGEMNLDQYYYMLECGSIE